MTIRTTAIVLCAMLGVAALSTAGAEPPRVRDETDKLVVENDHVRIWFQGEKPMLKVFPAGAPDDENAPGAYGYRFTEVVEYADLDGDGAPSPDEIVASLALDRATGWSVTRNESETNVTLDMRLNDSVKIARRSGTPLENVTDDLTLPTDQTASIGLVFTLSDATTTVNNVTVPASAIKYDFVVDAWPFVNAEIDRLALLMHVTGELELEGDNATVLANDSAVGALSWISTATGNTTEGEAIDVPVRVDVDAEDGTSRLAFTYDAAFLTTLVHDPTIGTASEEEALGGTSGESAEGGSSAEVPGFAPALLALALVGAALVGRGRKGA